MPASTGSTGLYTSPYAASGRWLRGNVHMHQYCCGHFDLGLSGLLYRLLGYDFVAITDHNQAHRPDAIQRWTEVAGLMIVPGEENGLSDHIIELGVHDVTPTLSDDYGERVRALRAAGGFVIGCHPQEYGARGEAQIRQAADELHAVEIYNALREARGTDEDRNIALWDEILSQGKQLWAVAGDDFHQSMIGPAQGWVQVQVPVDCDVTWPLIVDQLKAGAFYASTYPRFETIALADGLLTVVADNRTQQLRVIGEGGTERFSGSGSRLTWTVEDVGCYFRVEAESGRKRAWSQPFYRG